MTDVSASPANTETEPEVTPKGFEIRGVFYPIPVRFRAVDARLVYEVCGLPWDTFMEALDGDGLAPGVNELDVLIGWVACAVAKANPSWSRDRVVKFAGGIYEDEIDLHGFEPAAATGSDQPGPPAEPPATAEPQTTTATGQIEGPSTE